MIEGFIVCKIYKSCTLDYGFCKDWVLEVGYV